MQMKNQKKNEKRLKYQNKIQKQKILELKPLEKRIKEENFSLKSKLQSFKNKFTNLLKINQ